MQSRTILVAAACVVLALLLQSFASQRGDVPAERDVEGNSGWAQVYAHDAQGKPTGGNLEDLIRAVNGGSPVRVMLDLDQQHYFISLDHVSVCRGVVGGQSTPQIAGGRGNDGSLIYHEDSYYASTMVSTTGVREQYIWGLTGRTTFDGNQRQGRWSGRAAMRWYVMR